MWYPRPVSSLLLIFEWVWKARGRTSSIAVRHVRGTQQEILNGFGETKGQKPSTCTSTPLRTSTWLIRRTKNVTSPTKKQGRREERGLHGDLTFHRCTSCWVRYAQAASMYPTDTHLCRCRHKGRNAILIPHERVRSSCEKKVDDFLAAGCGCLHQSRAPLQ